MRPSCSRIFLALSMLTVTPGVASAERPPPLLVKTFGEIAKLVPDEAAFLQYVQTLRLDVPGAGPGDVGSSRPSKSSNQSSAAQSQAGAASALEQFRRQQRALKNSFDASSRAVKEEFDESQRALLNRFRAHLSQLKQSYAPQYKRWDRQKPKYRRNIKKFKKALIDPKVFADEEKSADEDDSDWVKKLEGLEEQMRKDLERRRTKRDIEQEKREAARREKERQERLRIERERKEREARLKAEEKKRATERKRQEAERRRQKRERKRRQADERKRERLERDRLERERLREAREARERARKEKEALRRREEERARRDVQRRAEEQEREKRKRETLRLQRLEEERAQRETKRKRAEALEREKEERKLRARLKREEQKQRALRREEAKRREADERTRRERARRRKQHTPAWTWKVVNEALNNQRVPVRHQGGRPTCAAFAAVRAIEIKLAQTNRHLSRSELDLSEQYVYWASKPKCQAEPCSSWGSWPVSALRASMRADEADIPLERDCPYNGRDLQDNQTQTPLRNRCHSSGQHKVVRYEQFKDIDELPAFLDKNHPVIGGFRLSPGFYRPNALLALQTERREGPSDRHAGGHAFNIVGYVNLPETLHRTEGKRCYIVANSWDEGWAEGGHSCITENWLKQHNTGNRLIAITAVE